MGMLSTGESFTGYGLFEFFFFFVNEVQIREFHLKSLILFHLPVLTEKLKQRVWCDLGCKIMKLD